MDIKIGLHFFLKCVRLPIFRRLGVVALVFGILAVCVSHLQTACQTRPQDKYLNDKYLSSPGVNPYAMDKGEMPVSGTIDQVATEFYGVKGKIYMFSLGFQPTTNDISEFEQILRNDFDGEIEIYKNGQPYKTIRYKDFNSFIWHPGDNIYGPEYNFKIEDYSVRYSFRPKIRSNRPYTYSLYIQRISFGARLKNLFKLKIQNKREQYADDIKHSAAEKKLDVPVIMERIDINFEKKGAYIESVFKV